MFELSGGSLNDQVVATGTSTIYGWLAQWNSTTVPNGTYSLVSVATDKDKDTDTSTPVSITVNNPLPTTSILIPSTGATLSGSTYLDASASNATAVKFLLFGGSYGYPPPPGSVRPQRRCTDGCAPGIRQRFPTIRMFSCRRPPIQLGTNSVRASA